jgi:hypothetical protein
VKFRTRDLIIMAIAVSIIYVVGKLNFAFSIAIPIPGISAALRAPFYAFVLAGTLLYTRKPGTMSMIMGVYAIIMSVTITPFSGLAIALGGIAADIISTIFVRKYKTDKSIIISAALFPPCSLIGTLFVVTFLTTAKIHKYNGAIEILTSLVITFLFSLIGSGLSVKLLKGKVYTPGTL